MVFMALVICMMARKNRAEDLAVLTDTVCTGTGKGGGFDKLFVNW